MQSALGLSIKGQVVRKASSSTSVAPKLAKTAKKQQDAGDSSTEEQQKVTVKVRKRGRNVLKPQPALTSEAQKQQLISIQENPVQRNSPVALGKLPESESAVGFEPGRTHT